MDCLLFKFLEHSFSGTLYWFIKFLPNTGVPSIETNGYQSPRFQINSAFLRERCCHHCSSSISWTTSSVIKLKNPSLLTMILVLYWANIRLTYLSVLGKPVQKPRGGVSMKECWLTEEKLNKCGSTAKKRTRAPVSEWWCLSGSKNNKVSWRNFWLPVEQMRAFY